jgi:uncharacterized membrane protein SirB2
VLLASALTLAYMLQQYPFVDHWLSAKVIALCLYIGLGSYVIKCRASQGHRLLAFIAAVCTFSYIVAVAMTHHPLPWLA